jgi:hypothetical protein
VSAFAGNATSSSSVETTALLSTRGGAHGRHGGGHGLVLAPPPGDGRSATVGGTIVETIGARAAATIAGWARCLRDRLKAAGRGEQNAEMLLVAKVDGALRFDDLGGWAQRNASMERIIRAADAAAEPPLPDFDTVVVQTGDRCIVKRIRADADGAERLELDLWQKQPLSAERRASLPLDRVLSMCGAPSYADVPVPDWACDAWTEAGLGSNYDETCAELAAAGALPAADARACWFGTTHHHPCRLRLVDLARAHPELIVVNNVYWTQAELAAAVRAHLREQRQRAAARRARRRAELWRGRGGVADDRAQAAAAVQLEIVGLSIAFSSSRVNLILRSFRKWYGYICPTNKSIWNRSCQVP